jgi:hypothetical protein
VIRLLAAFAAPVFAASACAKEVVDPVGRAIDFADPKSVLGGVFYAAQTGELASLAALCDDASEPSVRRLCDLAPGDAALPSFRAAFARARLNGEPRVHVDHAMLDFVYGPAATDRETMELARSAGRWHLLRF